MLVWTFSVISAFIWFYFESGKKLSERARFFSGCRNSMEDWKDIDGYPGYQISSYGNVKGKRVEFLKPRMDRYGYPTVILRSGKFSRCVKVHRLVAEHFLTNYENKPTINHINGIKTDNRLTNLEYSTQKEQAIHRCSVLGKSPTAEWNRRAIIMKSDTHQIYFQSVKYADTILGLYSGCLTDCLRRSKNKSWRGYKILYAEK